VITRLIEREYVFVRTSNSYLKEMLYSELADVVGREDITGNVV
jgi:hypothetical protein